MFRSKILNICSIGKRFAMHFLCPAALTLGLLVVQSMGCEGLKTDARDPLVDCMTHRDALCDRFAQCLGKSPSWHATCLSQQDQAGGSCEVLIATQSCYRSQSVQLAACADDLPGSACVDVCKTQGSQTVCNSPCSLICSTNKPGLRN